jgi:hypothetical protein
MNGVVLIHCGHFETISARIRENAASKRAIGARLPTPPAFVGNVVEALWKAGIFRLRGVLVGTLAYQTYAGLLGTRLPAAPIVTGDVDLAQFHSVSMLVDDSMAPILETPRAVDSSFRERRTSTVKR